MATITARKRADGSYRYTAQIRLHQGKKIVHDEAQTFSTRKAAEHWAKARREELKDPLTSLYAKDGETSLAVLIRWYVELFEAKSEWQRSHLSTLKCLEKHSISKVNVLKLSPSILVDHIKKRRLEGLAASTATNDLIWIGRVLREGKRLKRLFVRPEIINEARKQCVELGLIGRSRRRTRRPTPDELRQLEAFFNSSPRQAKIPMTDLMRFAIHSSRDVTEICRLEWADNDAETKTGLVREINPPKKSDPDHRRFRYTPEAWEIVRRQPKTSRYIFPYNPQSVGERFGRSCKIIGIKNLRFSDLRFEGTCRLFEKGFKPHEVAQFTLHDAWAELQRVARFLRCM